LGVIAVRLADSVPALIFGFHGGVVADLLDRRRTMIAADLVRAAILVPIAAAGLAGELPLAALVAAAFVLTGATSYFAPAYGRSCRRSSNGRTSSRRTHSSVRRPTPCP
jgi:hypothetical protein